jgi:hypothetical protein
VFLCLGALGSSSRAVSPIFGESNAKGSFGQKEFYFSNMGETALEEEPRAPRQRNTKHYDFSKNRIS